MIAKKSDMHPMISNVCTIFICIAATAYQRWEKLMFWWCLICAKIELLWRFVFASYRRTHTLDPKEEWWNDHKEVTNSEATLERADKMTETAWESHLISLDKCSGSLEDRWLLLRVLNSSGSGPVKSISAWLRKKPNANQPMSHKIKRKKYIFYSQITVVFTLYTINYYVWDISLSNY